MKKALILLLLICNVNFLSAHINIIDWEHIHFKNEIKQDLIFIIENEHTFNHWSAEWNYKLSKKRAVNILKRIQEVAQNKANNQEELLLVGLISHYLYNLEEEQYFLISESFYKEAIKVKKSFKAYWFLANHYAHSSKSEKAVLNYLIAEKLNSNIKIPEFWQDYTFAFYLAGMLSHSQKGLNNAKLLGKPSPYEDIILKVLNEKLKSFNPNKDYEANEIWTYETKENYAEFSSRALGIKFAIDTTWNYSVTKFHDKTNYLMISPKSEDNKQGKSIDYTIMIIAHIPENGESVEEFSKKFMQKYDSRETSYIFNEFRPDIAYEIKDSSLYSDIGGAHIQLMAMDRKKPIYPGLKLETPILLPKKDNQSDSITYYRLRSNYDRYEGNIQYLIILDTCEDIYTKSLSVFKQFLKQIIIE